MQNSFNIEGHKIGGDAPVFIIAEAGVNHNGDEALAGKLIDAAVEAGADCVKFQNFRAQDLVLASAVMAEYQKRNLGVDGRQLEMLKALEISPEVIGRLKAYCDQRGIVFMSTPYSHSDVDDLVAAGVSSFKLASIHCAEPAFVSFVASKGMPVVLSSGMCTLAEVDRAIAAHLATGNTALALLQCTTDYPSDARDANLLAMQKMGRMFPVVPGYSDHTAGSTVAIAAVALGAKVIERHLTLDTSMPGPDHAASLDPKQFESYVAALRTTESALGSDWKQPAAGEVKNKNVMRRCLVLREAQPNGHKLVQADFTFMRPLEAGIAVQDLERVAGLQLRCAKGKGEPLTWDDV